MPQEEYRRKRTTADEEAARIRSGDTVYLAVSYTHLTLPTSDLV